MTEYISRTFGIIFTSWIIGMIIYWCIKNSNFHNQELLHLNFIKSDQINIIIGLGVFRWIVKNTIFKMFNPKLNLKLQRRIEVNDLQYLRKELTTSEISHLIAFIIVNIVALLIAIVYSVAFGSILMLVNVVMNQYPCLLQQQNKRRIDKLLRIMVKS